MPIVIANYEVIVAEPNGIIGQGGCIQERMIYAGGRLLAAKVKACEHTLKTGHSTYVMSGSRVVCKYEGLPHGTQLELEFKHGPIPQGARPPDGHVEDPGRE